MNIGSVLKKSDAAKRAVKSQGLLVSATGLVVVAISLAVAAGGTAYAIHQENRDAFCASCHTEPESKYYQQSQDKAALTLASFHTQKLVRCIDCHSGGGPFGRVEGLMQGTHDLAAYYSGNYHKPAITQNKLGDDSCTKCHEQVTNGGGFDNHFHSLLLRWQSMNSNAAHCVDCHAAHPDGHQAQGYLAITTVQAVCQQCHATFRGGG